METVLGEEVPLRLNRLSCQIDQEETESQITDFRMSGQKFEGTKGIGSFPFKGAAILFGKGLWAGRNIRTRS